MFTWDDSKPYSDSFVSDDVTIRVIKNQCITVAVAGYDAKDHLVCEIFVLNERENRVDVMPMEFYLTYKDKDNKFQHEFPVPPEKLANKYRGRAKWGNFFRAFAAGMATTTSRTYESGTLNVYGRQGSTSGVYSGTTTTTTSDSAAQRRAAEVNASATASANAKAETVLSNALRANTLFPKTYTVGMVYFDRKEIDNWPVTAIKIRSGRTLLYSAELTTTAGRFLVVVWSVKGNGTRTTSPKL